MGVEGSETWSLLLDTAERLMRDKGYAAVTSRGLGREAELSPQIVYFYFRTMDDLFEAVFKRLADSLFVSLERAGKADEPLLSLWSIACDPTRAPLMAELISLSNHRKGLHRRIAEFGVEYNRRQAEIVRLEFEARGLDTVKLPPAAVASILENLARGFVFAGGYGIPSHDLAKKVVSEFLEKIFRRP